MVPWAPVGSPAMSWQWVSVLVRFATTSASTVSLGDSLFLCHSPIPRIMVTTIMAAITKNTSIKTTSNPPPQKIIRISPFASCMASEYHDARVKSLKPRCACTGVVLRLSDPPNMSIKVERQLHDMRILGRIVEVRSTEQSVRHLSTPVSYHTFVRFSRKIRKTHNFGRFLISVDTVDFS